MKTAIALLRVSTKGQDNGIDVQRDAIEVWAEVNDVTILAWHEERVSGKADIADRYGLLTALADVGVHRANFLVAHKRDRIARDPLVSILAEREVIKVGARICTVEGGVDGEGPTDKFMRRILDAVAELEREMIAARTKAALAAKKARGERVGSVPYGKRMVDGAMVADETEEAVIAVAKTLRAKGSSLRDIAKDLTSGGYPPRNGGTWSAEQIRRMVS